MKNRTVLITGATDGIGAHTALELARRGAHVLVHGRDAARTEAAARMVRDASGNEAVEPIVADLSSILGVRRLAEDVARRSDRLHVLINNAGVYMKERVLTQDALETTFMVNHLAPFGLTLLLGDLLRRSTPARVVTVSSVAHERAQVDFENLQGEKKFSAYGSYALSKFGNIVFTYELSRRWKGTGVTATCLHPGVVTTKLLRTGFGITGSSVEKGAETSIYLASSSEVEGVTGAYFVSRRQVTSSEQSRDRAVQQEFWSRSEHLFGTA